MNLCYNIYVILLHKLKILLLNFTSGIGGTERNLIEFAKLFKKMGHTVLTCTLEGEGNLSREFAKRNLPFVAIGMTSPAKLFKFFKFLRLISQNRFDVVYVFGFKAQVISAGFLKLLGTKVIVSGLQGTDDWRQFYHVIIERVSYPFISGWIAVSNQVKLAFMRRERIPANKIIVIPNAINTEIYSPDRLVNRINVRGEFNLNSTIFVVGYVSNIKPRKGHDDLLKAIAIVKKFHKDIKVFLVGEDRSGGAILNQIKKLNLEDQIILTGFISDIPRIMSLFDLFVIPSLEEGMPLSMLEAMAFKIPVIATPVGGIPEVIKDGVNGVLVPPKQPKILAEKIIELINNSELCESLAKQGLRTIETEFSLKSRIKETLDYFNELLKKYKLWKSA